MYLVPSKIRICRYLCTRAASPKKQRTEGLLMKLLQKNKRCTWSQIRICRYLCTRATSPPQKRTEGLLMKFQSWIGVCLAHPPGSTKEICYGDLVTEILWQKLPHSLIPIVFVKLCPPRTGGSFLARDTSTHTKLSSLPSLVLNHDFGQLYNF